ncbi:hypothetical protein ANCCAN_13737 [Ancylostoma caninum]|uniref:Retrotransposon gag domain-containing protein n=1 Tax=Ancylostoma caninum TaxID=29170 RepID=A0A368G7B0_ANCCA|nr:hypothetical protein ANCCAN_13737 [Ancylostoma caninum]
MSSPEGDPPINTPSGLTYGQLAPKTIKCFSGADNQDFESWLRRFEDVVRMVNPPLPDQLKTNTLVGFLEGEARDMVEDMPDQDKNTYSKIIEQLRAHFESHHFRSLARQQLSDCKQGQSESARDFAERVKKLVKKVTRGQPKKAQNERLLDEFLDRLKPTLRFHVKAANPPTFDEAVVKAITYESLLNDVANTLSIFPGTQQPAPAIPAVNVVSSPRNQSTFQRSEEQRRIDYRNRPLAPNQPKSSTAAFSTKKQFPIKIWPSQS